MQPRNRTGPPQRSAATRRALLVGAGAAAAAASLMPAAARSDPAGMANALADQARRLAQGRDVMLRMTIPNGSAANVEPVVAAFTRATGIGIDIEETHVDDINTRLILGVLGGDEGANGFDVALPATFGLHDLIGAGVIHPLNAFAEKYEPPGFRDSLLYSTGDRFDGETYGLQADGDTYLMFYNTDFLNDPEEQARYADLYGDALEIPLTWQQLDRQIAFFHRPDENRYGGALFRFRGYLGWEWWMRLHAKGVLPFSADMEPQIAGDAGQAALEEMLAVTPYLIPDVRSVGLFSNWQKFAAGNVYCNIGWGGTQKYLNRPESKVRGRITHALAPGDMINGKPVATPYFNWGWDYVVSRRSTEAEIAYLFCLFATSPEISTLSVGQRGGFLDPIRAEHYDDPAIREIYGDAFLAVHRKSLETSIPDLYLANQSEYFLVLNEWIDLAISKSVTPGDALRRIEVEWNLITYRSGREVQKTGWAELVAQYPQAGIRFRDGKPE